ncbi:MAG: alanine racemase [Spirochaetia bacterium]
MKDSWMADISDLRATQAVIHCKNLRKNYQQIKTYLPVGVKICAVVKANAYGHGLEGVASVLHSEGVQAFGVACLIEGAMLRRAGYDQAIYLLGMCLPEERVAAIEYALIPLVSSMQEVADWAAAGQSMKRVVSIQIGVDTGMGRIGCPPVDVQKMVDYVRTFSSLNLVGITSHMARADEHVRESSLAQISEFENITQQIQDKNICFHLANSAAVIEYKDAHYDMVRPGLLLYGYSPLCGIEREKLLVLPVMEFVTRVVFMKKVAAGTPISYGGRYITKCETWIATLGVGYADGYRRGLGDKAQVLIGGQLYPVVGSICMDQMMVDLGPQTHVQLYDKVVLFGDEEQRLSADHLAQALGTISYEILTSVASRVPRIFKD